jgi:hypothetical protein
MHVSDGEKNANTILFNSHNNSYAAWLWLMI